MSQSVERISKAELAERLEKQFGDTETVAEFCTGVCKDTMLLIQDCMEKIQSAVEQNKDALMLAGFNFVLLTNLENIDTDEVMSVLYGPNPDRLLLSGLLKFKQLSDSMEADKD